MNTKNNTIMLFLVFSLVFILTGCGITNEEFISSVENYQIFDSDNTYGMKTVSDFKKKMESFDESSSKLLTFIYTSWTSEKLKEQDSFIQHLKDNEAFVYDSEKYYGELSVNVTYASAIDMSTIEDITYVYLFSLDKGGAVVPEATATYEGSDYNYHDVITDSSEIALSMDACVLLTKTVKALYSR